MTLCDVCLMCLCIVWCCVVLWLYRAVLCVCVSRSYTENNAVKTIITLPCVLSKRSRVRRQDTLSETVDKLPRKGCISITVSNNSNKYFRKKIQLLLFFKLQEKKLHHVSSVIIFGAMVLLSHFLHFGIRPFLHHFF